MRRLALFLALTILFSAIPHQILAQESDPDAWSISEKPTVQMEAKEGEQILVDPLGYLWVRNYQNQIIEIYRGGGRGIGEEFDERRRQQNEYREYVTELSNKGLVAWEVYDSTGRWTKTAHLPMDLTIQTIGEDFIHGIWTNPQTGKKYVRMYSLGRVPESWVVSEEPTVQMEIKEGELILVDPLGYLWEGSPFIIYRNARYRVLSVLRNEPLPPREGAGMRVWDVFNSSGEEVGSRTRPSYVTIQTIGKDYIQAVWTGPKSGVEYFGAYSLDRSGSDADSWVISQKTTVQIEVKDGERILVDQLGYLWVKTPFLIYRGGTSFSEERENEIRDSRGPGFTIWNVFDPSGRMVTSLQRPGDVTIQKIGEDFIQGIWTDKEGKDYVRMYSLDRGG